MRIIWILKRARDAFGMISGIWTLRPGWILMKIDGREEDPFVVRFQQQLGK